MREDDYQNQSFLLGLCQVKGAPPIPAQENPLSRPVNHFYDPVNDRGLAAGQPATDWALGAADALQVPNQPDAGRANHYTIVDAREALYRALTGLATDGDAGIGPGGVAADAAVRDAYWATTFRILGDAVHLIQDMGQPQHTRNDPHAGVCGISGAKSVYEAYIDARAKGGSFMTPGGVEVNPAPLSYTGYPVPRFDDYVSYFTTRHLDGTDPVHRRGLADYSNRGFFSAGTNLFAPANGYALPVQNPPAYGRFDVTVNWAGDALPNNAAIELLTHAVPDTLNGDAPVVALTSLGLWDQFLEERSLLPRYTLTRANYDAMADLLVPRAVAYSAGFIDYFFRGRLDPAVEHYDGSGVTLNFTNRSQRDTLYHDNGQSTLIVAYRYRDGSGDWVQGTSLQRRVLATQDELAPGQQSGSYSFDFSPAIPQGAANLELRLVFHGRLGNERGAVAVGMEAMTSNGFLVRPNVLPADGISGYRHIYKSDGQWVLSPEPFAWVGNVDWKGHDRDDVLSFIGPPSRYFFPRGRMGYSPVIGRRGRIWTRVPLGAAVLGVGIRTVDGTRHLTAIANGAGTSIRVYSRLLADLYPNDDMYDAASNPLGWRLLHTTDTTALGGAVTPMFMNASATEAQGLFGTIGTTGSTRVKLSINGDSVTRSDFPSVGEYVETIDNEISYAPGFTVRTGIDNGDCTAEPACEQHGQCSGGGATVCVLWKVDTTSDVVYTKPKRTTYAQISPNVVAVDYAGDREVFATIARSALPSVIDQTDTLSNAFLNTTEPCTGNSITDSLKVSTRIDDWSTVFGLEYAADGATMPLNVATAQGTRTTTEQNSDRITTTGTTDSTESSMSYSNTLLYADLRHNHVVTAGLTIANSQSSSGSGVVGSYAVQVDASSARNYDQAVSLDGQRHVINNWQTVLPTSSSYTSSLLNIPFSCPGWTVSGPPSGPVFDSPQDVWERAMHPMAIKNELGHQDYATDHEGNVFASQTIWEQAGIVTPVEVGDWNFLTDGDPLALLGLSGSGAYFIAVGLY